MGTCEEEENDVQSKMISNGRASATEGDDKVWETGVRHFVPAVENND